MRKILPWALALLGACGNETPKKGGLKVQFVATHLERIDGFESELKVEHFSEASFGQVTTLYPEESFADAVVEGKSFEGFSQVYVLSLDLYNPGEKPLHVPDLLIRTPEAEDGEPNIAFRARNRTVSPQSRLRLLYFWDPGRAFSSLSARLAAVP